MNEKAVLQIISQALKLSEKAVTVDSGMQNLSEWDSLGHLSILVALDKAFDKKVAGIKEMSTADSVRKILAVLKAHGLL